MGIGGGLGGAVAVAAESTYGTFVTPTRSVEVHSAKLQERPHVQQGTGIAFGRSVDPGARRVNTWADAGGTVDLEFLNSGMALLLAHAVNPSATLSQMGTTTAYQLVCNYGIPDGHSFSMQTQVPNTAGTIIPENFHGCMITKSTWTIERGGLLMWQLAVDAQLKEESTVAIVPSYTTTAQNFSANGMNFKAGSFGAESPIDGVRKFELSIERSMDLSRIYLGDANKSQPVTENVTKITGSMDVDLLPANKAVLWDLFHSQTAVPSIVADFVGSAIGSSGHNNEFTLNPTDVFIDTSGTPSLDGPGITKATLGFTGLIDAANDSALIATLITGDTAF